MNVTFEKMFDYDMESMRIDAPRSNMGEWLNEQAIAIANKETGWFWKVWKTKLEYINGRTYYRVRLIPLSYNVELMCDYPRSG